MTVLKEFKDYVDRKISFEDYKKIRWDYRKKLKEKGWVDVPIEGGCLSPDCSTLFIYNRSPYDGQLIQFEYDTEEGYKKICNELINSGDFVDFNW